jgi:hypothetical protein
MQFKSITAIIVLLVVVASLSVAGCATSNTSSPTPTATPSATPSAKASALTVTWNTSTDAAIFQNATPTLHANTDVVTMAVDVKPTDACVKFHWDIDGTVQIPVVYNTCTVSTAVWGTRGMSSGAHEIHAVFDGNSQYPPITQTGRFIIA